MKYIKYGFLVCFAALLLLPVLMFNWQENYISEIDNKTLMNFPFGAQYQGTGDLTNDMDSYAQERIGFRSEMILTNQIIQRVLFGELEHGSYDYGKEGHIFYKFTKNIAYTSYYDIFADFTASASEYCQERGIPFLFVWTPRKDSVYTEYLPDGFQYRNDWVEEVLSQMEEKGVNVLDQTPYFRSLVQAGEVIYNKQYDVGHWNELGAFYGVNHILEALSQIDPRFQQNDLDDYEIGSRVESTLPVSLYPIHEEVPSISRKEAMEVESTSYDGELRINKRHPAQGYLVNQSNAEKDLPRVLVFQGSFMNGHGKKFLQDGLYEYIYIHNYQNFIDLDYYVNLFQPDIVVFELAESACSNNYFSQTAMEEKLLNPSVEDLTDPVSVPLSPSDLSAETGNAFTVIRCHSVPEDARYVYLKVGDQVYDMFREDSGYSLTLFREAYTGEEEVTLIYQK